MEKGNDGIINVSIPTVAGSVPLVILMKALGIEKDVDIHNAIYSDIRMDPLIYANIEDAKNPKILPPNGVNTKDDAISYLEKKICSGPGQGIQG